MCIKILILYKYISFLGNFNSYINLFLMYQFFISLLIYWSCIKLVLAVLYQFSNILYQFNNFVSIALLNVQEIINFIAIY